MDAVDIIYDHYKESCQLSLDAQKQRNRYFCGICVTEIISFIFLLYPSDVVEMLSSWLNEKHSVTLPLMLSCVQSILWILIVYYTIVYFQKNIYIERQYKYLRNLEESISEKAKIDCFSRESSNYTSEYPLVLSLIDFFYKWCIPIMLIIVNMTKIFFEYMNMSNVYVIIIDSACCLFVTVLTILYVKMINFPNEIQH